MRGESRSREKEFNLDSQIFLYNPLRSHNKYLSPLTGPPETQKSHLRNAEGLFYGHARS
jgi:hypothetical protein